MALTSELIPPARMQPSPAHKEAMDRLGIGLLVGSPKASPCEFAIAQWTQSQPGLKLAGLIIPGLPSIKGRDQERGPGKGGGHRQGQSVGPTRFAAMSWSLLIRLEALALRRHPRFHHHSTRYQPGDLAAKAGVFSECELLICLDPAVSAADLLAVAKRTDLGVLALRTGLGRERSSEPAGFWEVALQRDVTTFKIEHFTAGPPKCRALMSEEALTGSSHVLFRGAFATRFYFLLNQATLEAHAKAAIQHLVLEGRARFETDKSPVANPPLLTPRLDRGFGVGSGFGPDFAPDFGPDSGAERGFPDLLAQFRYGRSLLATLWKKWRNKYLLKNNYRWGVAFRRGGWQTLAMRRAQTIPNPPGHFLADPFVLSDQGRSFCFVEDYNYREAKAGISVYELHAGGATWIGPAIREPFHLSFPFLFKDQSKHYLCPESSASREIRLYECIALPDQWVFKKTLMRNIAAADTMLFKHGELWWLLTNIDSAGVGNYCSELHVFFATEPVTDLWTPHPQNPVIVDPSRARNGGLLFEGSTIFRVSQRQGFDAYGQSAAINRITALTPTVYQEEMVATITPDFFPHLKGTHHLHSDGQFTVFDYQY